MQRLIPDPVEVDNAKLVMSEVSNAVGASACAEWHYSKTIPPKLDVCYGFHRGGVFDGIIAFRSVNPPPVVKYWNALVGGPATELCRMALRPQSERPATTKYISMALRGLWEGGLWEGVYSYADAQEGHNGTVYLAASFLYAGKAERGVAGYAHDNGRVILGRRELNQGDDAKAYVADLIAQGYVAIPGVKHRFVKGLTRNANRRLNAISDAIAKYHVYWSGHRK